MEQNKIYSAGIWKTEFTREATTKLMSIQRIFLLQISRVLELYLHSTPSQATNQ